MPLSSICALIALLRRGAVFDRRGPGDDAGAVERRHHTLPAVQALHDLGQLPVGQTGLHRALDQPAVLQQQHARALQQLQSSGKRLACLTNKPTAFAHSLLKTKGLAEFFDVVYGGDAFERRKPDPLPLLKACEALGTPAQRTLMVGDSSNDAQAARAAGCAVWLVRYGYNHGEPIETVPADGYLDSLDQLLAAA